MTGRGAGPAPVRVEFDNGLTLLVQENRTQPAVAISVAVSAGAAADLPGGEGAAWLLSRLLDRGAGGRSAGEVADLLDLCGVSPAVGVTRHTTTVACDCLAEDVDAVLGLVCDMVRAPACSDGEVRLRRGQLVTRLRQDEDRPATRAVEAAMALLYGDAHPYGRRPRGSVDTVAAIDAGRLRDFHAAHFAPARTTVVLVGAIAAPAAEAAVARATDEWRGGGGAAEPRPAPPPPAARRRRMIPMPAKAQVDIAYGFTAVPRSDPAFHACRIMNLVLGEYGIGGRLGRSIRERQGMAYYAGSAFEASPIAGPLLVRAGVAAGNVDRAIASIDHEVDRFARDGVTAGELADAKRYLVGSLPRSLETNAGIARFLQNCEQFDLGLDYDRRVPELVRSVTAGQVAEAARRTLASDRAVIAVAGPCEAE